MPHIVVMVTTSYPRFPGDMVGTFLEPIAHGVAARGHEVHVVAPWHPLLRRPPQEAGVRFHFFKYAPWPSLNVFGYAGALRADTHLRLSAYLAAPLALAAGWRAARAVARRANATVLHGHWVVPGGAIAAAASEGRSLVVSLHGSDVFVAERHAAARAAARAVFRKAGWITACSDDLRTRAIALGASPDRVSVVPYGVDAERFRPSADARQRMRARFGVAGDEPLVVSAGRLVSKKGFEYLIDAVGALAPRWPTLRTIIAGAGDLAGPLRQRADAATPNARIDLPGAFNQDEIADLLAAADVIVIPSVHDDEGNVDGLPNIVMEALSSGVPVVATAVGGIPRVLEDGATGVLVAERDAPALERAIDELLRDPERGRRLGAAARRSVVERHGWSGVAEAFEAAYDRAARLPLK